MTNEDSKIEVMESVEETVTATALAENESSENKGKNGKYRNDTFLKHMKKNWVIYTFLIIPVAYYIVFRYIPMFGNIIAFRKYSAGGNIFGSQRSGLRFAARYPSRLPTICSSTASPWRPVSRASRMVYYISSFRSSAPLLSVLTVCGQVL